MNGEQQDKNRELTDVELDAASGAWADYVFNPAKTFMNPDNRNAIAIARSHDNLPINLPH